MWVLRIVVLAAGVGLAVGAFSAPAQAQEPKPPSYVQVKVCPDPYVHFE